MALQFKAGGYYCFDASGIVMKIYQKIETFFWEECWIAEVNSPFKFPELRAVSILPAAVKGWREIEYQEFIGRSAAMAERMPETNVPPRRPADNCMRDVAGVTEELATRDQLIVLVCGHTVRFGCNAKISLKPGMKIFCKECERQDKPKLKVLAGE